MGRSELEREVTELRQRCADQEAELRSLHPLRELADFAIALSVHRDEMPAGVPVLRNPFLVTAWRESMLRLAVGAYRAARGGDAQ